ncbi:MAG: phasin family protein [Cycloclasticus sp.]|jgi:phasin family protein|tara:strand:+ start:3808 stop:4155 length:348 start_codon:yes stop_codon:yes gene_type:complete
MMNLDAFLAPAKKMAEFNKVQIEKAIETQQAAVKEYVALTEARIKAATAIKDAEGFTTFVKEQVELAQNGFEKAVSDSKVLVEGVKAYNEEVIKLVQEGNAVITKEVKATAKKAA